MAQVKKANRPQFLFFCGNLEKETFSVVEFTGSDTISTPYSFSIKLISPKADIAAADVVFKQATLLMLRNDEYYPYSGVVLDFDYLETNVDHSIYTLTLVSRLAMLEYNVQTRIFQKMKVDDIVKKVLDDAKLSDYYEVDFKGSFPEREYVVQYQESDFNFINRLMEDAGIWYFFKEAPLPPDNANAVGKEKMVISNKPASFVNIGGENELKYRSASSLYASQEDKEKEFVSRISYTKRVVTKEVSVKNYNYRTPEVQLSAKKTISAGQTGNMYTYGDEFKDSDGAQKYAELYANRISSQQTEATGKTICRGFRAGMRFTLAEHEKRTECNDTYLITQVTHSGSHASLAGSEGMSSYINGFSALPSALIDIFAPQKRSTIPRINGVMTAQIETNGSEYAALDDSGRYKVRLPFDVSSAKNSEASKYVRLAQPYSGANYGMHFPSHEGAEMVLACMDGNPNRPMGIGTIPNANTKSPVVSGNKAQNVIRTAGKNEIILDDTQDKQKILLTTAAKNGAQFDDENKRVFVQTKDGNKLLLDDKNEQVSVNTKSGHSFAMVYKSGSEAITVTSKEGHVIKIDDKNKKLTIQTKEGHVIEMDDSGKKMTLRDCKGKNTVTLDGSKGLIMESQGEISIKASKDINIDGANIKVTSSQGKIEVKATQDLNLSGMKISEKATMDFKMEGLNVNTKATMKSKTEAGLGVEIKSDLQTKIGGAMTELSGQAMTTVKGGIVMIN
jgi:type VI secretion system secreted protein VgrG